MTIASLVFPGISFPQPFSEPAPDSPLVLPRGRARFPISPVPPFLLLHPVFGTHIIHGGPLLALRASRSPSAPLPSVLPRCSTAPAGHPFAPVRALPSRSAAAQRSASRSPSAPLPSACHAAQPLPAVHPFVPVRALSFSGGGCARSGFPAAFGSASFGLPRCSTAPGRATLLRRFGLCLLGGGCARSGFRSPSAPLPLGATRGCTFPRRLPCDAAGLAVPWARLPSAPWPLGLRASVSRLFFTSRGRRCLRPYGGTVEFLDSEGGIVLVPSRRLPDGTAGASPRESNGPPGRSSSPRA